MLLLLFGGVLTACSSESQQITLDAVADRQLVDLRVGDADLTVEVVNTPESLSQGLSGRQEIGSDGMFFVLPERTIARFWMKDMQMHLDMVWIDNLQVIGVSSDIPPPEPGTLDRALPIYPSPSEVTSVLELPAGMAETHGIAVGDAITLFELPQ